MTQHVSGSSQPDGAAPKAENGRSNIMAIARVAAYVLIPALLLVLLLLWNAHGDVQVERDEALSAEKQAVRRAETAESVERDLRNKLRHSEQELAMASEARKAAESMRDAQQQDLFVAKRTIQVAQAELASVRTKQQGAQAENQMLREAYNQVAEQLALAAKALSATGKQADTARAELEAVRQRLDRAEASGSQRQAAGDEARVELERSKREHADLSRKLEEAEALAGQLEEKRRHLQRTLEFYRLQFGPLPSQPMQPSHTGSVLVVDAKTNIVIISLGKEDGVKLGYRYVVSRGDKYIATIEIGNVMDKKASAFSVRDLEAGSIQRGDRISSQ